MPGPAGGVTDVQVAELLALVQAQAAIRARITRTAAAAAVDPFRTLDDWWHPAAVNRAAARAVAVVQPAQRTMARITDAYLARASSVLLGRRTSPAGAADVTRLRRAMPAAVVKSLVAQSRTSPFVVLGDTVNGPVTGVSDPVAWAIPDVGQRVRAGSRVAAAAPTRPYERIAEQYRYQVVAGGADERTALGKALVRVSAVAETDVTLAVREQVRRTLGTVRGVTGYRRILHPELSAEGPCGLCVVAADRIYHVKELKALHNRCRCETLPIIGDMDPGMRLNQDDLDKVYRAARSTGGGKRQAGALKKIRVALAEHGELGPVLVDADQHYRGPLEVARTEHPSRVVQQRAQLDAIEKSFADLQRRAAAGENVERALRWQAAKVKELLRSMNA